MHHFLVSGGFAIYIKTQMQNPIAQANADALVNFLFLVIVFRGQKILVGIFYDPPTISSYNLYSSNLEELLPKYKFLGDLNVKLYAFAIKKFTH
jgi:hypothetical protein